MKRPATGDRRRPHWHAPERGTGPAFLLSLFAHALLFLAIAFVVRWKTEPAGTVSAELWSGLPAPAPAPAPVPYPVPPPVVEPEPTPPPPKVETPPPPPPPRVETPAPEPEPKADIVLEQQKKELEAKKREAEKREAEKREAEKREAEKREAEKREAERRELAKREAEKKRLAQVEAQKKLEAEKKLEAQRREAAERKAEAERDRLRQEALARITAAAGPVNPAAGGTGVRGSAGGAAGGLPRGYDDQVVGCVRPHIVFNVPDGVRPKQYVAEFEVQLLPTGEQATAPKLLKASGLASYDQAVERAIRRCDPFPRPRDGAMPRTLRLTFDPVDTR